MLEFEAFEKRKNYNFMMTETTREKLRTLKEVFGVRSSSAVICQLIEQTYQTMKESEVTEC
jgi:hypothetical protein